MKYLTLALACGLMLSACVGTDDTPVQPPPGLEGLWQGTSVDDLNDAFGSIPIDSGEIYIALDNATDNPVDASFYTKSSTRNCLDLSTDEITHVGSNRYKDSSGGIAVMAANGNSMSLTISDNSSTLRMMLRKTTSLSTADLQTCGVQNDANELILSDQAGEGFLKTIATIIRQ